MIAYSSCRRLSKLFQGSPLRAQTPCINSWRICGRCQSSSPYLAYNRRRRRLSSLMIIITFHYPLPFSTFFLPFSSFYFLSSLRRPRSSPIVGFFCWLNLTHSLSIFSIKKRMIANEFFCGAPLLQHERTTETSFLMLLAQFKVWMGCAASQLLHVTCLISISGAFWHQLSLSQQLFDWFLL